MIPIYPAVYAILSGSASLAESVGERIYPDRLTQNATLPAVVYQAWFIRDPAKTTAGAGGFEDHRLQVDVYATTRIVADQVMEAVANRLDPRPEEADVRDSHNVLGLRLVFRQDTGAGRPLDDGIETNLFRRSLDFKVQAARAA